MKKLMMMALLLVAGLIGARAQEETGDLDRKYATELLRPGTAAPDFEIPLRDSVSTIKLSGLRGHYVVIDFWASWCPDCRKDVAQMKTLHEDYYGRGVAFVSVSFDTNAAAWQGFIQKNGMDWLHYSELRKWKKETQIDQAYRVNWIPTYYVVDPDGKVMCGTVMVEKVGELLNKLYEEGFLKDSSASLDALTGKK